MVDEVNESFCKKLSRDFSRVGCKTFVVPASYKTPATEYPLDTYGNVKLTRSSYRKDFIGIMEGVKGYDFFCTEEKIPVTDLKINDKTWMVDDPLHWEGMKGIAEKSRGNVLVGGLGLGLVLHALKKNKNVKSIDVYEINNDVIKLMKNKIPRDINIEKKDIFSYATERLQKKEKPMVCHDTIILDTWVGPGTWETKYKRRIHNMRLYNEMESAFALFKTACPESKIFIWGTNNKHMNPAVEKMPCKMVEEIKKEERKRRR